MKRLQEQKSASLTTNAFSVHFTGNSLMKPGNFPIPDCEGTSGSILFPKCLPIAAMLCCGSMEWCFIEEGHMTLTVKILISRVAWCWSTSTLREILQQLRLSYNVEWGPGEAPGGVQGPEQSCSHWSLVGMLAFMPLLERIMACWKGITTSISRCRPTNLLNVR